MKQFLRLLLAASVIAFAASMLAVSCGKTAGNNNNNNNNANNSGDNGGDGAGGGTPEPPPAGTITIDNFDAAAKLGTKVDGNDRVLLNAGAFPANRAILDSSGITGIVTTISPSVKRVFDLTITGGSNGAASAGLVLVDIGTRAKFADFVVPQRDAAVTYGSGMYVHRTTGTPTTINPAGTVFFGIFSDKTSRAGSNTDPNVAPFAFFYDALTQPIFLCRAAVSTMGATVTASTVLTGGQKSECFIGSRNHPFFGNRMNNWFLHTNRKESIYVTVAGLRTDSKQLSEILKEFTGTDTAKVAAFMDGLTTAEMALIDKANTTAFKKIRIDLLSSTAFAAAGTP